MPNVRNMNEELAIDIAIVTTNPGRPIPQSIYTEK